MRSASAFSAAMRSASAFSAAMRSASGASAAMRSASAFSAATRSASAFSAAFCACTPLLPFPLDLLPFRLFGTSGAGSSGAGSVVCSAEDLPSGSGGTGGASSGKMSCPNGSCSAALEFSASELLTLRHTKNASWHLHTLVNCSSICFFCASVHL